MTRATFPHRLAYVVATVVQALDVALGRARFMTARGVTRAAVAGLKVARARLPGVRCEARGPCLARGGWEVSLYRGDTGGGCSLCFLHADDFAGLRGGEVIPHRCDDACAHGESS